MRGEKSTMDELDIRYTISRRTFLYRAASGLSGVALFLFGYGRQESDSAMPVAGDPCGFLSVFEVKADVPARMLFPSHKRVVEPVQLTAIKCVRNSSKVLLRFTGGREIIWDKDVSFHNSVQARGGTVNREAVAPKVVVAYALHEIAQILRSLRARDLVRKKAEGTIDDTEYALEIDSVLQLKRDFEDFQEQKVLDAVTIGAIYELVRTLDVCANSVIRVLWDAKNTKFSVSSV
jgi:hypothetical protein